MTKRSAERQQFLADIITTAVEGGIGYWARGYGYSWSKGPTSTQITLVDHQQAWDLLDEVDGIQWDYGWLDAAQRADDERLRAITWTVDIDSIASALGVIRDKTKTLALAEKYRAQIIAADRANDGGDIDSDLADIIVQVACLGDVIYG